MNMLQLDPPIMVTIDGEGDGEANLILDYGQDRELFWVVFLDEDKRCLIVPNNKIKKGI